MKDGRRACTALAAVLALVLASCTTVGEYYDKWFGSATAQKPAELVPLKPTVNPKVVWQGSAGSAERFVFVPALDGSSVYAAGASGQITRFEGRSGKVLGRIDAKSRISGGVGGDANLVLVGTVRGEVLAFEPGGKPLWKAELASEVLSAPQIDQGVVVVRSGEIGRAHV